MERSPARGRAEADSPDADRIPRHVAIIMDGNGRWAERRGLSRIKGHRQGLEAVRSVVRSAGDLGIRYLTLYAFSLENWTRPAAEVRELMRLLDRSANLIGLRDLGFEEDDYNWFRQLIKRPNGIFLVTGPTGSGKTTTLYSALNEANDPDTKIITTEDPVEYDLDGIIQVQVNEEAGLTYGRALRSILRQDPDTILVGEIRDKETSSIAIEAALTGHLVFSTVHTNDAPLAVTRMIDLGVEPFLLTATLEAIVAQRLVRKVCTSCKVMYDPSDDVLMEIGLTPADVAGKQFAYGKGCDICHFTGFKGRTAIFETLLMTDRLREMIMDGAATDELRNVAKEQGMRSLRDSGLLAIFDGLTTVEEVLRETIDIM